MTLTITTQPDEDRGGHVEALATTASHVYFDKSRTATPLPPVYASVGVYSRSGYDIMRILYCVVTRPDPVVHLGPVDASCPLVLCDLEQPDAPIVYASEPFLGLTGYAEHEVLGRNCRFLQSPPTGAKQQAGSASSTSTAECTDTDAPSHYAMRQAIENRKETQVRVLNYRKNGSAFINLLTMISVAPDGLDDAGHDRRPMHGRARGGYRYMIGFQCDWEAAEAAVGHAQPWV